MQDSIQPPISDAARAEKINLEIHNGLGAHFDPGRLMNLARDRGYEARTNLAKHVGYLFDGSLNSREASLAADILLQIITDAERELRELLASQLAENGFVPKELILLLAQDEISVARPVLLSSPLLEDQDLVQIIKGKTTYHRRAIARRGSIGKEVINSLMESADADALVVMLENNHIKLDVPTTRRLVRMAQKISKLRQPLSARHELEAEVATELYWWLAQDLRRKLLARFAMSANQIDTALENVLQQLINGQLVYGHVTSEMDEIAAHMAEARKITPALLVRVLRRQQNALFIALLAQWAGLSYHAAELAVADHSGSSLAIICRAAAIAKAEFASIFLLSRSSKSGGKAPDPRELTRALSLFDRASPPVAKMIVERWRQEPTLLERATAYGAETLVVGAVN